MKHQTDFASEQAAISPAERLASANLALHAVTGIRPDGTPELEGAAGRRVVALEPAPLLADSLIAVCKPFGSDMEQLAVLGYLSPSQLVTQVVKAPQVETDIVLRAGRSELRLHADGRIRIKGDDVKFEANGRMGLTGAFIELN
ncbi:MAG: hypothetical protein ACK5MQ_07010 [Pikeienuella sp.]